MSDNAPSQATPCGLLRRLAVILYDGLLLLALLFIAAGVPLLFTGGEPSSEYNPLMTVWLLLVTYLYFGWFWTGGRRSLGMQTWRVRLRRSDGGAPGWGQAALRFAVALLSWLPLGLGFWWSLFDARRRTWHDMASGTELVVLPRGRV